MSAKILLSALILSYCMLVGQSGNADEASLTSVTSINVSSAHDYIENQTEALVLDVRTPAEFEMSHIPDAVNLNVQDEAFEEMAAKLDRNKAYIVHCTKNPVDGRSSRALATLQELGFKNLYSLEGGYIAWKEADLPLIEENH